jgi:hypothetical protein
MANGARQHDPVCRLGGKFKLSDRLSNTGASAISMRSDIRAAHIADGVHDDPGSQHFRQDPRVLFSGDVQRVSGHSAASEGIERLRNRVVIASPIGPHQNDVILSKAFLNIGCAQGYTLIDLATETPACGEVDKYRPALRLVARDPIG